MPTIARQPRVALAFWVACGLVAASGAARAEALFQVRHNSIGCVSERATLALSSPEEPRRSDPGWVAFVRRDGQCVDVTPTSRWALVRVGGPTTLARNVVPGSGALLYIPTVDFVAQVGRSAAASTPRAARSDSGGKYCIDNGSTMLLTRPAANGGLEFGMTSWTAQKIFFGVSGLAQPEAGGWHYRKDMSAGDPSERCEIRIGKLPDGGYSFGVTQAGNCEANGGHNAAPSPDHPILFPARSRQGDIPRNKSVAEATSLESGGISCAIPRRGH